MTSPDGPGLVQRMSTALYCMLKRGILGKADSYYMKKFSGDDQYWDRVIGAQRGWPREQITGAGSDSGADRGENGPGKGSDAQSATSRASRTDYEPIYGWTILARDDYLARNPGARAGYELEASLHEHGNSTGSPRSLATSVPALPPDKET